VCVRACARCLVRLCTGIGSAILCGAVWLRSEGVCKVCVCGGRRNLSLTSLRPVRHRRASSICYFFLGFNTQTNTRQLVPLSLSLSLTLSLSLSLSHTHTATYVCVCVCVCVCSFGAVCIVKGGSSGMHGRWRARAS
jgi:hypothetical protein